MALAFPGAMRVMHTFVMISSLIYVVGTSNNGLGMSHSVCANLYSIPILMVSQLQLQDPATAYRLRTSRRSIISIGRNSEYFT